MAENIQNITDAEFESVVAENHSVLVDFWAPWCGPCKMIAPVLAEIAAEKTGLKVVKINIDENSEVASRMGVRGIPTLALFKGGQHSATKIGAVTKSQLIAFLDTQGIS